MAFIRIGDKNIPIIKHFVFNTGEPGSRPSFVFDVSATDIIGDGINVGHSEAASNYHNPGAVGSTSNAITGGRTGIGGAEIVFTVNKATAVPPIDGRIDGNFLIEYVDQQQQTMQLDSSNLTITGQSVPRYYQEIVDDYWVAFSFNWPNATAEKDRVNGYIIGHAYQMTEYDPITGNLHARVNTHTLASELGWVNIPYYNYAYNLSLNYQEVTEDEPPFDPSEPEPFDPNAPHDDTSDLISIPNDPTIGVTNAGFINVYNPAMGALQGLGDILFPNVASATDIVDAVLKLCETFANSNLINYVIDCHVIPCTPVVGSNASIKVGFRDTGITVPKVTSDYVLVNCGSLSLNEYFHGAPDYIGTRSKIYLPFIGFVDTKPEYWQAGTIGIQYRFNIIDGSFMAYITSVSSKSNLNGSVIAQYAGNACMHFPITGVNYANMVSGLVGQAVAIGTGKTTIDSLQSAMSAANTIAQGGDVQQSNGYNSTSAILGVRAPFLLIERPVPAFPSKYGHDKGYPSNITVNLISVTGFTIIEDIDLSGIPLTQGELEELRGLLKEGVYF